MQAKGSLVRKLYNKFSHFTTVHGLQDADGKIKINLMYDMCITVILHSFYTLQRSRNRFIRRYMGLSMEQPGYDEWTWADIAHILSAFWDIKQMVIEGQYIEVFYANDVELRTLNRTEPRSPPSNYQAGVPADLDSQK